MRNRLIILYLWLTAYGVSAQQPHYDFHTDTLTYQYYLTGQWQQLIDSAKAANRKGIDFKYLRQRAGYAQFMRANYYASEHEYEKALAFDPHDSNTHTYLYYTALYRADENLARYRSGFLPVDVRTREHIRNTKLVDALDLEYCLKTNTSPTRGNQNYLRLGVSTQISSRLSLYQSGSMFTQTNKSSAFTSEINLATITTDSSMVNQYEYSFNLAYSIAAHHQAQLYGHFIHTSLPTYFKAKVYSFESRISTTTATYRNTLNGYLAGTRYDYSFSRFRAGISGSVLAYNQLFTQQYGLHLEANLPELNYCKLNTSCYVMHNSNGTKSIISGTVGALVLKKLWLEASVYNGNMDYFTDHNGLYVYNALDPGIFKSGLTAYLKVSKKFSIFGNYTYELKQTENNITKYNQHALSTGIIWKL